MQITLTNKAIEFLRDMLAEAGWSKSDSTHLSVKRVYLAGKMLAEVLPEVDKTQLKELAKPFTLDDKMLDTCKVCISFFIKEGRVPVNFAVTELIAAFALYQD